MNFFFIPEILLDLDFKVKKRLEFEKKLYFANKFLSSKMHDNKYNKN